MPDLSAPRMLVIGGVHKHSHRCWGMTELSSWCATAHSVLTKVPEWCVIIEVGSVRKLRPREGKWFRLATQLMTGRAGEWTPEPWLLGKMPPWAGHLGRLRTLQWANGHWGWAKHACKHFFGMNSSCLHSSLEWRCHQYPVLQMRGLRCRTLNNLQLVNGEPGLEPNGSGSRAHIPTADKGPTVYVIALPVSTLQRNIYSRSRGLSSPCQALPCFISCWRWNSDDLGFLRNSPHAREGAHSFIHLTDTMDIYSARRCAVCYRNETEVRVLAQTGDTAIAWTPACPAPASASCGALGSKPSEHLFPQL